MIGDLAADLAALIGADAVRYGEAVAALDPGWHKDNLAAGLVVAPRDVEAVSRLLAWCNDHRVAVVPQGGRTGLVGGGASSPGMVVLSLHRLDHILALDPDARVALVEAGVTLQRLQEAAAAAALDPGI